MAAAQLVELAGTAGSAPAAIGPRVAKSLLELAPMLEGSADTCGEGLIDIGLQSARGAVHGGLCRDVLDFEIAFPIPQGTNLILAGLE